MKISRGILAGIGFAIILVAVVMLARDRRQKAPVNADIGDPYISGGAVGGGGFDSLEESDPPAVRNKRAGAASDNPVRKDGRKVSWRGPLAPMYQGLLSASVSDSNVRVDEVVDVLLQYWDADYIGRSDLLKDALLYVSNNSFLKDQIKMSLEDPQVLDMIADMEARGIAQEAIEQFVSSEQEMVQPLFEMLADQREVFSERFTAVHGLSGSEVVRALSPIHTILPRSQIDIPVKEQAVSTQ